jgi:hypothetical protein
MGSAETRFQEAYAAWRLQPFPSGSTNDEIDELHADLALVDSCVAETVLPFVERGEHVSPGVDVARGT